MEALERIVGHLHKRRRVLLDPAAAAALAEEPDEPWPTRRAAGKRRRVQQDGSPPSPDSGPEASHELVAPPPFVPVDKDGRPLEWAVRITVAAHQISLSRHLMSLWFPGAEYPLAVKFTADMDGKPAMPKAVELQVQGRAKVTNQHVLSGSSGAFKCIRGCVVTRVVKLPGDALRLVAYSPEKEPGAARAQAAQFAAWVQRAKPAAGWAPRAAARAGDEAAAAAAADEAAAAEAAAAEAAAAAAEKAAAAERAGGRPRRGAPPLPPRPAPPLPRRGPAARGGAGRAAAPAAPQPQPALLLPRLPEVALDPSAPPTWGACAAAAASALDGVVQAQQALGEGEAAQAAAASYVDGMVSERSTSQVMSFVLFSYSVLRRSCQSGRAAAALECVRWLAGQGRPRSDGGGGGGGGSQQEGGGGTP